MSFYDNNPMHQRAFLRNGSAVLFNVLGTDINPVIFGWTVPPGFLFHLKEVDLVITSTGNISMVERFMNMGGPLTHGLLFRTVIDGVTNIAVNLKTNFDLLNQMNATFDLKVIGQQNVIVGNVVLQRPIVFDGDNFDKLDMCVQDDLTSLGYSAVSIVGTLELKPQM